MGSFDALVYVICGPSGCGKTTVGALLASKLQCTFYDADDYHPESNIAKMRSGIPLTDEDRWPWLKQLGAILQQHVQQGTRVVMACSALKKAYRQMLTSAATATGADAADACGDHPAASNSHRQRDTGRSPVVFVLLNPSRQQLLARLQHRPNHFMPASLLDSQLKTVEAEGVQFCFSGNEAAPDQIVDAVLKWKQ